MIFFKRRILFIFFILQFSLLGAQIVFYNAKEVADYALEHSDLQKLNLKYAETSLKVAAFSLQNFLPTFYFSVNEDDSIITNGADSRSKSVSAGVSQTVFDGGKRLFLYKMEKSEKLFDLKSVQQNAEFFKSSVNKAYYNCLLLEKKVQIKTELEQNACIQLEILKKECELGLSLENDYLEYLIAYKKIQNEKKQAQRELRSALRQLKILCSIDLNTELILHNSSGRIEEQKETFYLEEHTEKIWAVLKKNSPAIQKQEASLLYSRQQYLYNRRFFVPEVNLEAQVSFSGNEYPLNSPRYSAKLSVNFANLPFVPVLLSNGYGFKEKNISSINNSASASLSFETDYFYSQRKAKISLQQQKEELSEELNSLYENLFETIAQHDDALDSILRLKETIELQKHRLDVSEVQVKNGILKRIDLLEQLTELVSQKIQFEEAQIKVALLIAELEIQLCIPSGGLKECLD